MFWKKLDFRRMLKNTPRIGFFELCKIFSPLMCKFFWFKGCTILAFMILQKQDVWEKYGSQVICKKALDQPDGRIFKYLLSQNYRRYKTAFLHAGTYPVKPQMYQFLSWGMVKNAQTCPRGSKTLKIFIFLSQWGVHLVITSLERLERYNLKKLKLGTIISYGNWNSM